MKQLQLRLQAASVLGGFLFRVGVHALPQNAAPINDPPQAVVHGGDEGPDRGEQEDRRHRELNDVSDVGDVRFHRRRNEAIEGRMPQSTPRLAFVQLKIRSAS